MDTDPETTAEPSLIDRLETLEGRAVRDFFAADYDRAAREIPSKAKLTAYDLLNAETTVPERKLFALVDAVSCVLAHNGRYGGEETARLALETVTGSSVALAAVRALVGDR